MHRRAAPEQRPLGLGRERLDSNRTPIYAERLKAAVLEAVKNVTIRTDVAMKLPIAW